MSDDYPIKTDNNQFIKISLAHYHVKQDDKIKKTCKLKVHRSISAKITLITNVIITFSYFSKANFKLSKDHCPQNDLLFLFK